MILPFLLALLAFATLLAIVWPLLRGNRPGASRASFDQAVYRDQLLELDRDITRGVITPQDAATARLEIQRRLLAADRLPARPTRLSRSPLLAALVFVVIAGGAVPLYLWLGDPEMPDVPFAARTTDQDHAQASLQEEAAKLAAKLKQNPSDAAGWLLYARSLSMLGAWDQADDAYRHAIDLGQTSPDIIADRAEVQVMQAGGTVTPAAAAAFRQVLATDPSSGIARYYLAVAAMQAGEPRQAIDGFQALLAEMPPDSPLRPQLGQRVAEAAHAAGIPVPELAKGTAPTLPVPGPDAAVAAGAANMSDEQRQAMIRGMVAKLAAEQQANPQNLDGWLRLGRAYAVLHEPDKAADAYDQAAKLRPADTSIPLQEVRALLSNHPPTEKLPPRVVSLLKQIESAQPDEPLVLWYLGMNAAQDGQTDTARRYWSRLLTKLPPGGEDAKMIQSAIDALGKN